MEDNISSINVNNISIDKCVAKISATSSDIKKDECSSSAYSCNKQSHLFQIKSSFVEALNKVTATFMIKIEMRYMLVTNTWSCSCRV